MAEQESLDEPADRIVEVAADLFVRRGFDRVTMEEVAAGAGVSRATVYRRFDGREQLISAVVLAAARRYLDRIDALPAQVPGFAGQVEAAFVIGVLDMPGDPVLASLFAMGGAGRSLVLHAESLRAAVAGTMRPLLDRARASGEMRPDIDTDEVIAWLLRELFGLVESGSWQLEGLIRQVRMFVLPALLCSSTPPNRLEERLTRIEEQLEELRSGLSVERRMPAGRGG